MTINADAPRGRGCPAHLVLALRLLPSSNDSTDIAIGLPPPGQLRVRRLVHRGAPRPTTKVPSVLLDRIVQCESVLEAELASILDACPGVVWFAEQPAVINYRHNGISKSHIPDFAVATRHGCEFVEVKFESDVTEWVVERTTQLAALLRPYGMGYRLVTESDIRVGTALKNARQLLVRGREATPPMWALQACEAVRNMGAMTLSAFGWNQPGSFEAAVIARQILEGRLHIDMSKAVSPETSVFVVPSLRKENQLWQPAASK